jgi:hypothetical protein
MRSAMNRLPVCILPLVALFATGVARARHRENSADPQTPRHVSISTGEHPLELQLVPVGESAPVAQCSNYCDFWALPGRYTLYLKDPATGEQHDVGLRIRDSARYAVDPGDDTARNVGLGLGIAGPVALFTGLILTLPLVFANICEDSNCVTDADRRAANIGLGFLLGGVVMTPVGWTLFASNRTRVTPLTAPPYAAPSNGPSVRVGVVGIAGGLGLGGVAAF